MRSSKAPPNQKIRGKFYPTPPNLASELDKCNARWGYLGTSHDLQRMHLKLTKHGRFCKQKQLSPYQTHVELKDNSNVDNLKLSLHNLIHNLHNSKLKLDYKHHYVYIQIMYTIYTIMCTFELPPRDHIQATLSTYNIILRQQFGQLPMSVYTEKVKLLKWPHSQQLEEELHVLQHPLKRVLLPF